MIKHFPCKSLSNKSFSLIRPAATGWIFFYFLFFSTKLNNVYGKTTSHVAGLPKLTRSNVFNQLTKLLTLPALLF